MSQEVAATVDLEVPITAYGEKTSRLVFNRRPNLGDFRAADGEEGEFGVMVIVISRCCGIPPSAAEEIDPVDFDKVGEVVRGFTGSSPRTGGSQ